METYSSKIIKIEGQRVVLDLNEELNIERLKTFYEGFKGDRQAEIKILDPRQFTVQQRRFIYALLGDIYDFTYQPIESLKQVFKLRYEALTGQKISLADYSSNTVDDVTLYADIIINFMFEFDIPFSKGYEILPQNRAYFYYKCCVKRKCFICGKRADIHHFEAIGMGANRRHHDHSKHTFMALCREHHNEIHQVGSATFVNKYHVESIKLNEKAIKRLNL